MNRAEYVLLLIRLFMILPDVVSHHILLLPINMMTSYSSFGPLAHVLMKRGHGVTIVIGAKMAVPDDLIHSKADFIFYDMLGGALGESQGLGETMFDAANKQEGPKPEEVLGDIVKGMQEEAEQIFMDDVLMQKLSHKTFDFAVTDTHDILRVVPYRLGIPFAVMGPECPWWEMTLPYNPSHVPHFTTSYSEVMNLKERARNLMAYLYSSALFLEETGYEKVRDYAPDRPLVGYDKINAKISLCLRLREVVTDSYRALPPSVINIGRILTKGSRPLPDNLQLLSFVSGAQDGFILVSFGAWFADWPTMVIHKFLEAFARIRHIRIIWEFTIPTVWTFRLPDNVRIFDTVPENDLLAHPKCRLFITHLDIFGLTDSLYNGVPILGFPMGLDQHSNGALVNAYQYGVTMNIYKFKEQQLYKAILKVINGNYAAHTKEASSIFKSLPSGSDAAVYWIDHVIRHGASHLKPHANLRWWEYLMLDILGLAALALMMVLFVIYIILERCHYLCCSMKFKQD